MNRSGNQRHLFHINSYKVDHHSIVLSEASKYYPIYHRITHPNSIRPHTERTKLSKLSQIDAIMNKTINYSIKEKKKLRIPNYPRLSNNMKYALDPEK